MANFTIQKSKLVDIVSACQNRTFSQELDILIQTSNNIDWLIKALDTNQKNGIPDDQFNLQARKDKYGNNQKYVKDPPGFFQLLWGALQDFTLRILIIAAIISIIIQVATAKPQDRGTSWIQGAAILIAVAVCALVTAINDYQKQRQFQQLNSVADARKKVTLKRGNKTLEMHQDFVLVGDVVQLAEGMEIPADGILLQANQITTDQSAMTGQTDPIHKNTIEQCLKKKQEIEANGQKNTTGKHDVPSPILMSGTRILTGQGKMLILVVGDQSCLGKIRSILDQQQAQPTPLQMKLETIAQDIGKFGLVSAVAILIILLIRFAIEKGISREWDTGKDLAQLLNFCILAITVIVVAIPEGLPLAVTLSLAFSVKKMLNDNNLVRKMQACQTMGGANNICSDKTGTLTLNKMTLTTIWNGGLIDIDNYKVETKIQDYMTNKKYIQLFAISSCVNSTANLRPQVKGSSTQIAILNFMEKNKFIYQEYRNNYQTKLKYPFSSARKRMSVICQYQGDNTLFVKGASQMILACCTQWYNQKTGQIQPINQQIKKYMESSIISMAQKSLRTLCFAYKKLRASDDLESKDDKGVFEVQKHDLICLALIGVKDIPRQEVPQAIKKCHRAGIKVRMVTGDNIITAKAIAKQVGIIKDEQNDIVMQGSQFIRLTGGVVCKKCETAICNCAKDSKQAQETGQQVRVDTIKNGEQFDKLMNNLLVLARSRPEDKYALVTGLKERGQVVAVTGDGTNDAPALKKADVGFAMGINGTQVARQSAAIILLDDNFNSIVKAVLWGRNIYDAIRKFIQFQLTVNVVAVLTTLVIATLLKQQILRPIQMLWVNLIMDTLASLALATEPPTQDLLDRRPHGRDDYIISKTMFKHIIGQAIYQSIILFILCFAGQFIIPQFPDSFDETIFAQHPQWKYNMGMIGGTVRSGRQYFINGDHDYYNIEQQIHVPSRHFTFIFNTFVMMQIFNFLNARKLNEQLNVFEGLTRNFMFLSIVGIIFLLQILLITFTGIAFNVYTNFGLHPIQWLMSIGIGSVGLVISVILKFIPIKNENLQFGKKQSDPRKKSISLKNIDARFQRDIAHNISHAHY